MAKEKIELIDEIQLSCDNFMKKEEEALMDFCKKLYIKSERYLLSFIKDPSKSIILSNEENEGNSNSLQIGSIQTDSIISSEDNLNSINQNSNELIKDDTIDQKLLKRFSDVYLKDESKDDLTSQNEDILSNNLELQREKELRLENDILEYKKDEILKDLHINETYENAIDLKEESVGKRLSSSSNTESAPSIDNIITNKEIPVLQNEKIDVVIPRQNEKFSFKLNQKNDLIYEINNSYLNKSEEMPMTKLASKNDEINIFEIKDKNINDFDVLKTPEQNYKIFKNKEYCDIWNRKSSLNLEENLIEIKKLDETKTSFNSIIDDKVEKKMSLRNVDTKFKNSYQKIQNEGYDKFQFKNHLNIEKKNVSLWTNLNNNNDKEIPVSASGDKILSNEENDIIKGGGILKSFNNFVSILSQNASKYFCPMKSKDEMSNAFELNNNNNNILETHLNTNVKNEINGKEILQHNSNIVTDVRSFVPSVKALQSKKNGIIKKKPIYAIKKAAKLKEQEEEKERKRREHRLKIKEQLEMANKAKQIEHNNQKNTKKRVKELTTSPSKKPRYEVKKEINNNLTKNKENEIIEEAQYELTPQNLFGENEDRETYRKSKVIPSWANGIALETLAVKTDNLIIQKALPKKTEIDLLDVFGEPDPLVIRDVAKRKQAYLKRNPSNDWSDFIPYNQNLNK